MSKHAALVQALCLPYCRYYKQDRNEELLCRGAVIVDLLLRSGRGLDGFAPGSVPRTRAADDLMVNRLCSFCDFRENDCDFVQDRNAKPCGGFILLSELVRARVIAIEEIENARR